MEKLSEAIGELFRKATLIIITLVVLVFVAGVGFVGLMVFNPALANKITGYTNHVTYSKDETYNALYKELGIAPLKPNVIAKPAFRERLDILQREKCHDEARIQMENLLFGESLMRDAAKLAENYYDTCNADLRALERAYTYYRKLNDHGKSAEAASRLIDDQPFETGHYFLRGLAYQSKKDYGPALNDYIAAAELSLQKPHLIADIFVNQARMYEKLGRPCEAITPIQTYVSYDPEHRKNERTDTLIEKYRSLGQCGPQYAKGKTSIPIKSKSGIITKASINGVEGRFLVDTGASYVSINKSFADKAGLQGMAGKIALRSANGVVYGSVGIADHVKVRDLQADKVSVVIMGNGEKPLGDEIDGLLGMSFLARFDVKIGEHRMILTSR